MLAFVPLSAVSCVAIKPYARPLQHILIHATCHYVSDFHYLHAGACAFVCSKPCGNEAVRQAIAPDVECPPLLGNRLSQPNDTSLRLHVVHQQHTIRVAEAAT